MSHVLEDLELYAIGTLAAADRRRVESHLGACERCRTDASAFAAVVDALPETVPDREPPDRLRKRILATASGERAPAAARRVWLRPGLVRAALVATVAAVLVAGAPGIADAAAQIAERNEIARRVTVEGDTWYMRATEGFGQGGAMLYAPEAGSAFAVVNDLGRAPSGSTYTLWLVDDAGRWVRAANFDTNGWSRRLVDLGMVARGYERCAITLEGSASGRRQGPILMQSLIYEGAR